MIWSPLSQHHGVPIITPRGEVQDNTTILYELLWRICQHKSGGFLRQITIVPSLCLVAKMTFSEYCHGSPRWYPPHPYERSQKSSMAFKTILRNTRKRLKQSRTKRAGCQIQRKCSQKLWYRSVLYRLHGHRKNYNARNEKSTPVSTVAPEHFICILFRTSNIFSIITSRKSMSDASAQKRTKQNSLIREHGSQVSKRMTFKVERRYSVPRRNV